MKSFSLDFICAPRYYCSEVTKAKQQGYSNEPYQYHDNTNQVSVNLRMRILPLNRSHSDQSTPLVFINLYVSSLDALCLSLKEFMVFKKDAIKVALSLDDRNRLVSFVMLLMQVDKRVNKDGKIKQKSKTKIKTKITSIYRDKTRLQSGSFYFFPTHVSLAN